MATSGGFKRNADALDNDLSKIDMSKVPPYDARTEQAPLSVLLSKEWQTLEQGRDFIAKLITDDFKNSEYSTKLTQDLVERVERELLKPERENIVVCVSGNMGGGKSTTLNSLFQVGNIAREGDSGGSCTLASNSFGRARKGQKSPLLAEVCFYPVKQRREIIAGYLRDFYRASHNIGEEEEGSVEDSSSPAIRDEVVGVFVALYSEHSECRTKQDVRFFLQDAASEDDPHVLAKLYGWDDRLIRKATRGEKVVSLEASTPGELITKLDAFATEVEFGDGESGFALWPMVSLIRFCFDDPLTTLGITFLDTPGSTDHNRTRRISALRYSRKKTHSIIVSDASRAKDDPLVATEAKVMSARGPDRVIIVLPKSDIISDTTMPPGSRKDKDRARELKDEHTALVKSYERMEEKINKCYEDEDDVQAADLNKRKRKLEVHVKHAENKEKAHRIQMRADSTKDKLQEKLKDFVQVTRPIPIYAISNKMYQQHLNGYLAKNAPALSAEETNVPELRRKLATLPNEARLNEAKHNQCTLIPGLLMRFSLYTARTPMERKADLDKYIRLPLTKYDKIIKGCFDQFALTLEERIVDQLRMEETSWISSARVLCVKWEDYNKTAPFLALMNREGHRKATKKNAGVNMSGELIDLRSQKLSALFQRAVQHHNDFEKAMSEELDDLASDMITSLRDDPNYGFVDLARFIDYINHQKGRIRHAVNQTSMRVLEGLELIQRKATMSDEDSYVAEAMAPIYKSVALLKHAKGKLRPKSGWPQHRKDIFKQEVTRIKGIWSAVYTMVRSDLKDVLNTEKATLDNQIGTVFKDFQEGFDSMCETKASMDPKEKELQEQLKVSLRKAEQHLEGSMKNAFELLWRDFHREY